MESLFVYLAKASGLLALFFLAYYLLIRRETFFNSSRFFLVAGIFTSALLPLIVYTKIVWVAPTVIQEPLIMQGMLPQSAISIAADQPFEINWWYVALALYTTGVLFFFSRLIIDLYRIISLLKDQQKVYSNGFILIDSPLVNSPFSFFKYIVYNTATLTFDELENIIAHEKVHSRQLHSLDMLLNQLTCTFLWFNPISWLYKKQVTQNLEFIADAEAAKNITDLKAYQKTLLKITLQPECIAITNHFYQSLIKKRIVMLNKPQSKRLNLIKFAFILPATAAFFYLFQTEVIAQEREAASKQKQSENTTEDKVAYLSEVAYGSELEYPVLAVTNVDKNLSEKTMKERKEMYKDIFDADVTFKNVKRNKKGEITAITVMVKDKNNTKSYPVYEVISTDNTPIYPFNLYVEKLTKDSDNKISFQKVEQNRTNTTVGTTTDTKVVKSGIYNPVEYINSRMKKSDVVVIINGKVQKSKYIDTPPGEKFESIIEYDSKSTLKLYNVKTKDGSIVLTTKKIDNPVSSNAEKKKTPNAATNRFEVIGAKIDENVWQNDNQASGYSERKKMPETANNRFKATGVKLDENIWQNNKTQSVRTIVVTTITGEDGEPIYNNDKDNIFYIIDKNTTGIQLNTSKEDLESHGIRMVYSDVKRNSRGTITAINLKISDQTNDSKSYTTSDPHRYESGIPNIYIGKIKGQLAASASK